MWKSERQICVHTWAQPVEPRNSFPFTSSSLPSFCYSLLRSFSHSSSLLLSSLPDVLSASPSSVLPSTLLSYRLKPTCSRRENYITVLTGRKKDMQCWVKINVSVLMLINSNQIDHWLILRLIYSCSKKRLYTFTALHFGTIHLIMYNNQTHNHSIPCADKDL